MQSQDSRQRYIVFGLLIFVFVILPIGLYLLTRGESIDVAPTESSQLDYSKSANIQKSEALLDALDADERFESLSLDVFAFAKAQYTQYKDPNKVVGFEVKSVELKDPMVNVVGRYGSVGSDIKIELKLLANYRVHTKITDTKSGIVTEEGLPSNSKLNVLISELPKSGQDYVAEYDRRMDAVVVSLFVRDVTIGEKALESLRSQIDSSDHDRITLNFPLSIEEPVNGIESKFNEDGSVRVEGS